MIKTPRSEWSDVPFPRPMKWTKRSKAIRTNLNLVRDVYRVANRADGVDAEPLVEKIKTNHTSSELYYSFGFPMEMRDKSTYYSLSTPFSQFLL